MLSFTCKLHINDDALFYFLGNVSLGNTQFPGTIKSSLWGIGVRFHTTGLVAVWTHRASLTVLDSPCLPLLSLVT